MNDFDVFLTSFSLLFFAYLCIAYRNYHEGYVSPDEDLLFRVSPYYLLDMTDIQIQFNGIDDGSFVVCMARNRDFNDDVDCQTVSGYETISFYFIVPCESKNVCRAIYFRISVDSSLVKCLGLFTTLS